MTTKQILFSVFLLGTMSTIGLAMESHQNAKHFNQKNAKRFNKGLATKLLDKESLYDAIYKQTTGNNQKIHIIKYDNGTYTTDKKFNTISKLNHRRPHHDIDIRELGNKMDNLLTYFRANNAIFCSEGKKRIIVYNITDPSKCAETLALYQQILQENALQ